MVETHKDAVIEVEERIAGGCNYTQIQSRIKILDSGYVIIEEHDKVYPPHKVEWIDVSGEDE